MKTHALIFALAGLVCLHFCTGCGSGQTQPQPFTDAACQRAIEDLHQAKAAGVPCTVAKARVRAAEPLCPLHYTCPDEIDGGHE